MLILEVFVGVQYRQAELAQLAFWVAELQEEDLRNHKHRADNLFHDDTLLHNSIYQLVPIALAVLLLDNSRRCARSSIFIGAVLESLYTLLEALFAHDFHSLDCAQRCNHAVVAGLSEHRRDHVHFILLGADCLRIDLLLVQDAASGLLPHVRNFHLEESLDGVAKEDFSLNGLLDFLPASPQQSMERQQHISKLHFGIVENGQLQLVRFDVGQQVQVVFFGSIWIGLYSNGVHRVLVVGCLIVVFGMAKLAGSEARLHPPGLQWLFCKESDDNRNLPWQSMRLCGERQEAEDEPAGVITFHELGAHNCS